MLFIFIFSNTKARIFPTNIPKIIPVIIEIGIFRKLNIDQSPPVLRAKKDEKNTITKTSSTLAPAKIISGIFLSTP